MAVARLAIQVAAMSAEAETPSPLGQHPDPESERSEPRVALTVEEARSIQTPCVDVYGIMSRAVAHAAQQRAAEEHADVAAPAVPVRWCSWEAQFA